MMKLDDTMHNAWQHDTNNDTCLIVVPVLHSPLYLPHLSPPARVLTMVTMLIGAIQ